MRVRAVIVSSALPTPCGLATFTEALGGALRRLGMDVGIIRVVDHDDVDGHAGALDVAAIWHAGGEDSFLTAVAVANGADIVIVQHEYGLYGGVDGDEVVRFLRELRVPTVAILHTVIPRPTDHQIVVLDDVMDAVDAVVVMTSSARTTLSEVFHPGDTRVSVIAHGAATTGDIVARDHVRPMLLTWGLLGPGKGIEWVIDALADLRDLQPTPFYVVAGRTHPKVLNREGEAYRRSLERRALRRGVDQMVIFDNDYRSTSSLHRLIAEADIVVLPYDSTDQATSGVLVDALAAGRPIIATAFPHAVEALLPDAGMVVPHRNARAMSSAVRQLLTEPGLADHFAAGARALAPSLSWDAVAHTYADVMSSAMAPRPARIS